MNNLVLIKHNNQFVAESRQVAEMVGKRHDNLMRDIKGYCEILEAALKFEVSDFFIESSYVDSTKRTLPCYLITKKGCEMIANKMTGKKGVLFTAEYVTRFNETEKAIQNPIKELSPLLQLLISMELNIAELKTEVASLKQNTPQALQIPAKTLNGKLLIPGTWREEAHRKIVETAERKHGGVNLKCRLIKRSYQELEFHTGVNLENLLDKLRSKLAKQGVSRAKRDRLNYIDAIAEDPALVSAYVEIVDKFSRQ